MEEGTLELLKALQTAERTETGLAGVQARLAEQRPGLRARGDRATLADASELLEVWAEAAPGPVAAGALTLSADIAERDLEQHERAEQLHARALELAPTQLASLDALERILRAAGRREEVEPLLAAHVDRLANAEGHDPEVLAQLLRKLGGLRDASSDLAGAISAYERALEHSADPELVRELAEAYARRAAPGDGNQAADLFQMLAEVLEPGESHALIERALDLAPGHLGALTMLENATPEAERANALVPRWERFVANADDDEAVDARRPALARAYLDAGRAKDALACIGPLVDRGDSAAAELQTECLAALRASEVPAEEPARATKGEQPREPTLVGFRLPRSSAPPAGSAEDEAVVAASGKPGSGVHKRPAQSGGTLVGFRLSEETLAALRAQDAAEASLKAQAAAADEAKREPGPATAPSAEPLRDERPRDEQPSAKQEDATTTAEAASAASTPAEQAAKAAAASAALTPAEHAARLRKSVPAPAPAPAATPSPPAPKAAPSYETRPRATRASTHAALRHGSTPPTRPSAAPALGPAQLAESLRGSRGASTPPPARASSAELAASAAAQHAAALRRSSPGSIPAPAPSPRPSASAAAPAPTSLAAASAHAAALRRSSPGALAAATAMTLPAEEAVHAERPPLSAVAPELVSELAREQEPHEPSPHESQPQARPVAALEAAESETTHTPDDSELSEAAPEAEAAESALPASSPFAVAPAPVMNLPTEAFGAATPKAGGGGKRWAIAAAAAVVVGGAAFALFSGGDEPASSATPSAAPAATPSTSATPTSAAPPSAVGAAAPAPSAAPPAAGAAAAAVPGAVAAGTAGSAAAAPAAGGAEPSAPTQDEEVLGRVELAGAAKIRGGKLRPKDVADAVKAQLPALERCYTETLEDKPSAEGALTFGFTVSRAGKATAVKKLSGTLKDAALARCAADALGDTRFDKPKRPAKVTLPLRFEKR